MPPQGKTSEELMLEYQARAIVLRQTITFKPGGREIRLKDKQALWLGVIHTMLSEAFEASLQSQESKNYDLIREVMRKGEFLNSPKTKHPSEVFYAVQIVSRCQLVTLSALLTLMSSA